MYLTPSKLFKYPILKSSLRKSVHTWQPTRCLSIFDKKAKITFNLNPNILFKHNQIDVANHSNIVKRTFLNSPPSQNDEDTDTYVGSSGKALRAVKRRLKQENLKGQTAPTGFHVVGTAIVSNMLVALGKFFGFFFTGSGSMLSEGIHSLADTANQSLLYIGLRRSQLGPDKMYPYGHGPEQFVWALISAVGIFFVGSGCTIYHGISTLLHPSQLVHIPLALGVLGVSLVLEGYTLYVAFKECSRAAAELGMSVKDYVVNGQDVTTIAVLMEDSAAVLGVGIAGACVGLTYWTGNPMYDSIGSIMVGTILGGVAMFLVQKNKDALVGKTIATDQQERIIELLQQDSVIRSIHNVKAVSLSSQILRFSVEVDFNGEEVSKRYIQKTKLDIHKLREEVDSDEKMEQFLIKYGDGVIDALGLEVDRIEEEIKKEVPEVKFVDLETY